MAETERFQIYTESKGIFNVYRQDNKIFSWHFPIAASLEESLEAVQFLEEQILTAIEKQKEKDKQNDQIKKEEK